MFCILIVAVLLHLPTSWTGDVCPSKSILPSCTCRNVLLENGQAVTFVPKGSSVATKSVVTRSPTENRRSKGRSLYTIVDCKMFRTPTALYETISQGLHRRKVDKLVVSNVPPTIENTLARLPGRWLKNVRIKQFEVHDSLLSGDFISYDNPFEGQANHMLSLAANRCSLKGALSYDEAGSTNTKGLEKLPRIEDVDFSFNHLITIKSTAFQKPPAKLGNVVLAHNSLKVIEKGAFGNITLLNSLDLSHNLLEEVNRQIFAASAPKLQKINLSWNFIETLPPDFFNGMPALQDLNLSKNFLYSLPEKPYGSVWRQIKYADLTGNYIECDCNLLWLAPSPNTTAPASAPASSGDRIVKGKCVSNQKPGFYSVLYNLDTLERNSLLC